MKNKLHISYAFLYNELLNRLVNMILSEKPNLKVIYGIPRGGLPIAVHLSHYLKIPLIVSIYKLMDDLDGEDENCNISSEEVLVVDDLTDTGKTFRDLISFMKDNVKNFTKFTTATLIYKPRTDIKDLFVPDFYAYTTLDWCIFPWERLDEIPNREGY